MTGPDRSASTGGRAIMRAIRGYGVDTVFGIPGTHNLEFYRLLAELGIRPVTARHEQGAGYAADGWSQRRGLPGVVVTTSGPGLLNVLSAAGTAFCESRPLLVLSPGTPRGTGFADRGVLHESKDPTGAAGAVMLWSRRVESDAEAVEAVHEAFALFQAGRPRPVHIEVPLDVLEGPATVGEGFLARRHRPLVAPDRSAVAEAARLLDAASRPLIVAGGGAVPAADAVRRLAERLGAPVLTTLNGKGVLPETHPLSLRAELRLAASADVVRSADAVLVIGSKLGEAELWGNAFAPAGPVVRIDLDPARIDTNLRADVALVGDSRLAVEALAAAVSTDRREPGDLEGVRSAQRAEAEAFSPLVMAAADAITAALPAGATVAGDSSQITYYGMTSTVLQEEPKRFLYMPAYATLGYGLPAAIGAAIAEPGSPVVCVLGDGALMFSVQELATAAEQGLDLTVVVVDNGGYREIRENELDRGIAPVGVDLFQPDWPRLAEAFGGTGHAVTAADEVTQTVAAAIREPGVSLVHVPLGVFERAADEETTTSEEWISA
ncbi:thiamine pyrophosphate-binding protein [Leifsonia sp. F6_8S_P_1B]|uniref:Thiamine pyrophosphate-binding protein n=1 Tax=Leifsonia williamsii TaxID=3035919 RepID=A0ABT8K8P8_9MICO|nr:thiamine pyrophosphate-dependent enzyme [Leifsonia williamsii]MDN4613841.1 thiamine pyrophosphate-binding protein [Leifsonia williamsii]